MLFLRWKNSSFPKSEKNATWHPRKNKSKRSTDRIFRFNIILQLRFPRFHLTCAYSVRVDQSQNFKVSRFRSRSYAIVSPLFFRGVLKATPCERVTRRCDGCDLKKRFSFHPAAWRFSRRSISVGCLNAKAMPLLLPSSPSSLPR